MNFKIKNTCGHNIGLTWGSGVILQKGGMYNAFLSNHEWLELFFNVGNSYSPFNKDFKNVMIYKK